MNYPGTRYTRQMMETVCFPAMEEVAQELKLRGAYVELKSLPPEEGDSLGHLDLLVHGRRAELCLSDLAAAVLHSRHTYRARREVDLLSSGDLPAGRSQGND